MWHTGGGAVERDGPVLQPRHVQRRGLQVRVEALGPFGLRCQPAEARRSLWVQDRGGRKCGPSKNTTQKNQGKGGEIAQKNAKRCKKLK